MTATIRERSGSTRSATSDGRTTQTPPQSNRNAYPSAVPSGLVLEDVPNHRNASSPLLVPPSFGGGSPYPVLPNLNSQRPRANTYGEPILYQNQGGYSQYNVARNPPSAMHAHIHPAYRPSPGQQGQQYIPPPPPPANSAATAHGLALPPPPPRPPPQNILPPPPPGYPPNSSHNYWHRQATYPPPPGSANTPAAYNPNAYHPYQPGPQISIPTPLDERPLLSATYIPTADSFGPGVGIPPLYQQSGLYQDHHIQHTFYRPESLDFTPTSDSPSSQRYGNYAGLADGNNPPAYPSGNLPRFQPNDKKADFADVQSASSGDHASKTNSLNKTNNRAVSVEDPAAGLNAQWSLDQVILWLSKNSFSQDWQETFRYLNLSGAHFLEIGKSQGGKGGIGMLHQVIYPQLEKICNGSGRGWNKKRERDEGKRMRRLVRTIVEKGSSPASATFGLSEKEHSQGLNSAGADGGLESSPNMGYHESIVTTPSTAGNGEDSPGHQELASTKSGDAGSTNRYADQTQAMTSAITESLESMARSSARDSTDSNLNLTRRYNSARQRNQRISTEGFSVSNSAIHSRRSDASPQISPGLYSELRSAANSAQGRRLAHARDVSSGSSHSLMVNNGRNGTGSESHTGSETPVSAKEHRNISWFRKKDKKKDGAHNSTDNLSLDSPTSSVGFHHISQQLSSMVSGSHSKHNSLDRPVSRQSPREDSHDISTIYEADNPKFIFVTPDAWNYRLIDVTYVKTATELRQTICENLGIVEDSFASFHLTTLAQTEHSEDLSDETLLQVRDQFADPLGTLKIYVSTPDAVGLGLDVPQSATSPAFNTFTGSIKSMNNQTGIPRHANRKLEMTKGSDIHMTNTKTTSRLQDAASIRNIQSGRRNGFEVNEQGRQREVERSSCERKAASQYEDLALGTKKGRFVNFDRPRDSPYEGAAGADEREVGPLIPRRPPPPAPSNSSTLSRANTLQRKSIVSTKQSGPEDKVSQQKRASDQHIMTHKKTISGTSPRSSGGISALIEPGKMGDAVGTTGMRMNDSVIGGRSMSKQGNRARDRSCMSSNSDLRSSPGNSGLTTMSKGDIPFKIPDYDDDTVSSDFSRQGKQHQISPERSKVSKLKVDDDSSPETLISPHTPHPPNDTLSRFPTRRSCGPQLDFEEVQPDFLRSPAVREGDSDSDPDGELFAKPLKRPNNIGNEPVSKVSNSKAAPLNGKPLLTIKTKTSTSFEKTKPSASRDPETNDSTIDSNADYASSLSKPPESWYAESPDDDIQNRRQSFISDGWANRPPVEDLVKRLDEFFPLVDLDQPMIKDDELPLTSPTLPMSNLLPTSPHLMEPKRGTPVAVDKLKNQAKEANGSEVISFPSSVAQKSLRKSGLPGRTKSIREVVNGAHRHSSKILPQPGPSNPSRVGTLKGENLLRRRSTKMFGAKTEQVRPPKGSRLSQMETIPHDIITTPSVPTRQATFKWMKGSLIGKGTFGRVYLGMNITTGEPLAVKQIEVNKRAAGQDKDKVKEMMKALDQEIDTMQHLDHVNIVQYLGCERKEISISIFLEYIPGGSIGSCLRKHGRFEEKVVSSLTRQTLAGLSYLHSEGILHRDLKADNILLDLDGTCKISDFGISKKSDNIYGNDSTNSMQGSVFWMAPEVVRSHGQGYSAKVDIWSLGCVVLEMFAGKRPWSKEEVIGAIYKLGNLGLAPPIPDDVSGSISPAAYSFMLDCFTM